MSNAVTRTQRNARAHILETAWRLVGERGVHAVTVADIAAASGVSRQLVYHHFESRAGLLVAMARHHDDVERLSRPVRGLARAGARRGARGTAAPVAGVRAPDPAGGPRSRGRGHHGRRRRRRVARPDGRHPRGLSPRGRADRRATAGSRDGWTVDTAADWMHARSHVSTWQHLVVDRGWPAADYVERTIASIMAEVVAASRRRMTIRPGSIPASALSPRRRGCPLDPGPIVCPVETGSGPPRGQWLSLRVFVAGGDGGLVRPSSRSSHCHVWEGTRRAAHLPPTRGRKPFRPAVEPVSQIGYVHGDG